MIIGIDPGLQGAFALLDPATGAVSVLDMPTTVDVAGSQRRRLDIPALVSLTRGLAALEPVLTILEQVGARGKDSAASMFAFGRGFGALETALHAAGIPPRMVPPAKWKGALHVPADKGQARAAATTVFPRHAHLWQRVKDDGRAEAALIAYYGWKHIR